MTSPRVGAGEPPSPRPTRRRPEEAFLEYVERLRDEERASATGIDDALFQAAVQEVLSRLGGGTEPR